MATRKVSPTLAVVALLVGAFVWGAIWYPYRALAGWGVDGPMATLLTYGVALAIATLLYGSSWIHRPGWMLVALALAAGVTNVGFVWAVIHGQVLRVMLLFYLMPVWTLLFAWMLLGERASAVGAAVATVSLCGAALMLYVPTLGVPWPQSAADWVGLMCGMSFALSNVLLRRAQAHSPGQRSLWVLAGCSILAAVVCIVDPAPLHVASSDISDVLVLIAILGIILVVTNLVVQTGLENIEATEAPVILVFELVVTATSSWLLVGERIGLKEAVGGGLIVVAGFLSRMTNREPVLVS